MHEWPRRRHSEFIGGLINTYEVLAKKGRVQIGPIAMPEIRTSLRLMTNSELEIGLETLVDAPYHKDLPRREGPGRRFLALKWERFML